MSLRERGKREELTPEIIICLKVPTETRGGEQKRPFSEGRKDRGEISSCTQAKKEEGGESDGKTGSSARPTERQECVLDRTNRITRKA